ncbi:hypothetical protein LCGC14_1460140 [marine sediment metagenome]|uniref:Uncharacterized protein n=1 Tax=marine sediment metagenome TaxID=412755 RepID=A0A0F9LVX2_9ZZZZ
MNKRILAYLCLMGTSVALLWHFSNIWIYGSHYIGEPSRIVLSLETVLLVGIFGFGVFMIIKDMEV